MTDTPNLEELAASIPPRGPWWWFSFVDSDTGEFLGGCLVRGITAKEALLRSHLLKINPGGEAAFQPVPADMPPPEVYCDRLLTRAECEALDQEWSPSTPSATH